jgi:CheY-like chemotaxis protein
MNPDHQILLIVEDDLFTRELYIDMLKAAGFSIDTAFDGEEGLKKIEEGGYSLILLDIILPKLDGLQLLNTLKTNPPKKQNGPIIVLTNLAHDKVLNEALALGAKACLIKADYNPDQLVKKIQSFL